MILPDWRIDQLCKEGMVVPYDPGLLNPASLDVCVGDRLLLLCGNALINRLLAMVGVPNRLINKYLGGFKSVDISGKTKDDPYWLQPGDRALIGSKEVFNFPDGVTAHFQLKSSRCRDFYEHLESGFCHPGWNGSVLTMEIINHNTRPLPVYPGMAMGSMIFYQMTQLPRRSYRETGRYNNDKNVSPSKG